MAQPTACKKCGVAHWRFIRCDAAEDWHAQHKTVSKQAPHFIQQPREGMRPWGDRLNDYQNLGGNLVLDRPIKHGRNTIVPDEWGWKD